MTSRDEHLATLVELTKESRFCMLTTVDTDGTLVSRPMSRQDVDLDVEMWFIATRDSRKAQHLRANPSAGVTVSTDTSWVSLAGTAEIVDDTAKLEELWSTFAEAWLPEGPQDPNAVLVRFDATTAEYWDNPGGKVSTLISLAKSKLTGQPYDGGENEVVTGL
ncbi:pyridoxamine 5'-phosphate oxidase family protein [Aeromicrobium chenweiae]|uniref:Pyridoxamine 5'-phosphate oxidase n=1 Tax=Aeromicrobium chenweiae TaxID=2079793 RepID=A0A2S0WLX3_9ACTN|nr:pyridoxamine 5'-phosphate oxidase family protein [Aeromicrobium chenweiae]AWB92349.1 pyridoxamine 5'-phosphate oxidase [Aeromicrobium chenweiae]TGN31364.1 pyridoxamine 5'-phosphate oxidase [Aeromicrobium chenweiae]